MIVESITSEIINIIAQICVVIISAYGATLIGKVQKKIELSKKKDEVAIVDKITDEAVIAVEKDNPGVNGEEKKKLAVEKSKAILEEKGVNVSDEHIEQSIEDGVFKMNISKGKYTSSNDNTADLRNDFLTRDLEDVEELEAENEPIMDELEVVEESNDITKNDTTFSNKLKNMRV